MGGMTIKDLREAKGNRTIAYVQVAGEEEAVAASANIPLTLEATLRI